MSLQYLKTAVAENDSEKLIRYVRLGDGSGLRAVDTTVGRGGGLICWEHWMPY